MITKQSSAGFTLIEAMIAVVIVAIVGAIAYPAYKGYTVSANRSEGTIELNKIAIAQERFFSNNNSYTTNIASLPGYNANPLVTEKGHYSISAAAGPGGIGISFVLTATPQGNQTKDKCTEITLNSAGVKGGSPSKDDCWTK